MFTKDKVKYVIVVLILLSQSIFIFAQNMSEIPTFGIKGGILLSTVTGDNAIDQYAKKLGPQIGVTGALYFNPKLSIRAELNYELKGGKFANHEMNMNLHYATIPLYLKFNITEDPEFYVYGGAYGSYLITANTKGTYEIIIGDDVITESINENINANLNHFDAGIIVGVGAQGRFNQWADIFIDIRYTQGFFNLNNNKADLRYNFNYESFWPEQNLGTPLNKALMFTTGFVVFIDPR